MEEKDLEVYKKKLAELAEDEKKLRLQHIKDIADGKVYGPNVGYASIDMQWLKHYEKNNIILEKELCTCYDFVKNENVDSLNNTAINFVNKKITYSELFDNVDKVTKALIAQGVKKGDTATIISACVPESMYLFYALNRLGAAANFVDPRIKNEEIIEAVKDSSSKYVFCLDLRMRKEMVNIMKQETPVEKIVSFSPVQSLSPVIQKITSIKNKVAKINDPLVIKWNKFINSGKKKIIVEPEFEKDLPAIMVRTGGTTGKPKTVVLSNENMNEMAFQHKIGGYNFEKKDKFLNFLPPFYAYGICAATHMPLVLGLENIMIPTFDANDFPGLMEKYKPNVVFGGPILYEKMMADKNIKNIDLSNFTVPVSGGDSMSVEVETKVNNYFKEHGGKHNVGQGYGMTEVASSVCYSKENSYSEGSVGIPLIHNKIAIFNPETMVEMQNGQEGEICIQTGTMMINYLNNEDETNKVIKIHSDGTKWVHTGDIGYMNENGNLFVKGRMKRMIVSNGSKIFPSEIENIINKNQNVEMCAVVGTSHEMLRKVPVAHVVFKEDVEDIEDNIQKIIEDIKKNLPDYYLPHVFAIKDSLPLTNVNKISFTDLEKENFDFSEQIVDCRTLGKKR